MPDYKVKVQYQYPVQAISPQDALSTVPFVIKARFNGFHGKGITEVIDAEGKTVLTAELVPATKK